MGCLLATRYNFWADVYKRTTIKQPSGQIKYTWSFLKTIRCSAETIDSDGIRVVGTSERFGNLYENIDYVYLITSKALSRSYRISNIRPTRSGLAAWKEDELSGTPATVFNVNGSAPVVDPFGRIIEHKTLLQRAEVQDD